MNIEEALRKEHSKTQTDRIVAYVGQDALRFEALMDLFFNGEYRVAQRAAWPMGHIALDYPTLYEPYLEKAISLLAKENVHDAVLRNILRILQNLSIPEHLQGDLVEACLKFILAPQQPVAIKAFAISTLQNICRQHPEMAIEVKLILKERIEFEKPAFVSRAKRFLKEFK